jgi:alkanesulfonate monooxygenase SsuD/methylene tetrahydromethanopterin reductase-like flavin-dependent oxidoreductase (luciferase family)
MEAGRWSSAWFYDHFIPPFSFTAEVMEHDGIATYEGWSLISGAAAITNRLRLGLLVAGNTYRNPALMAKMAATVDQMSKGRIQLGMGAAWNIREHQAYGWDFPSAKERSGRLEEACKLLKTLFTAEGLVDFQGEYYTLKQAPFEPKAVQQPHPPIVVGGTGEKRTLRTAALYGDVMNVIASPEEFKRLVGVLERHCEDVGRNPATIRKTVHVPIRIMENEARAAELRRGDDWNMIGPVSYVIDRVGDFIDAGVDEFMMSAVPNKPNVYQELDEKILSAFE